ncbi:hypothetical protein JW916_02435 [Candidatus Sumerlaeota bacterium]|nr:hypothetical protein [Candidatus Sumerlaeota bacterium]
MQNRDPKTRRFTGFEANVFPPPASSEEPVWDIQFDSSGSDENEPEEESEVERARKEIERQLEMAREALSEANRDAERIVEDARRRSEEIEAVAYQAGFQQGEEAGQRLSDQKTETAMRSLRELLEEIEKQRSEYVQSCEENLVRLALLIALRLIHREIRQDPSVVFDVVREAVTRVRRASRLTVFVSPHDFKFIEGHLDDLTGLTSRETRISIEPDSDIGRGGCRVTSNAGEVDATIDSMIHNIQKRLWEAETQNEE